MNESLFDLTPPDTLINSAPPPTQLLLARAPLLLVFTCHLFFKFYKKSAIQIICFMFIAAFGASQRNACDLHGVRDYELGVGLRKVVEHNTLAIVGAWP